MDYTDYTYACLEDLELKASFYRSEKAETDRTILYFHGGGLVYGKRQDLPDEYIFNLLEAGYHFLAFDYPLAPESSLRVITQAVKDGIYWFVENARSTLQLNQSDYVLFGRSAGAYLCYLMAADETLPKPKRLIAFYGYSSLAHQAFTEPSAHYMQFPQLPETVISRLIKPYPIAEAPLQTRFALYLHARQSGKWLDLLTDSSEDITTYELTEEQLNQLPPTFIAHSRTDKDVPYGIAEKLSHQIPEVYLHSIPNGDHDFDRDTESADGPRTYQQLINWLKDEQHV
ncbi:alpha/beta hydrolase [Alkalibacterium sp.]